MTTPNLGETPNSPRRDAVHIPVIPVPAGEELNPGDRVTMRDGYAFRTVDAPTIGIVDPFRTDPVKPFLMFWLFMHKIDGQPRHAWVSPDFPDELDTAYSEGMAEGQCCYGGG